MYTGDLCIMFIIGNYQKKSRIILLEAFEGKSLPEWELKLLIKT